MVSLLTVVLPLLIVAGGTAAALTIAGIRYRGEPGAEWFAATMGWTTVAIATTIARFVLDARPLLVFLEVVGNATVQTLPALWFCFVLAYTGRGDLLGPRTLLLLFAVPLVTVVTIASNSFHNLYSDGYELFVVEPGVVVLTTSPGPVAYLGLFYAGILFVVGLWLIVRMLSEYDRLFSGQAAWLLIGSLVPILAAFASASGFVPTGIPILSSSFAVTGVAYGYGLFHHRIFDVSPATRRIGSKEAIENLSEGVIVVASDGTIVNSNENAARLFDCPRSEALGNHISVVAPELATVYDSDDTVDVTRGGTVYEVTTSTVDDARGRDQGHAVVVRDVTDQRGREQRLEVLNRILRHNLRNDMNVVKVYANELAESTSGAEAEMASTINRTVDDFVELAEKARHIERTIATDSTETTQVELCELVSAVGADVRRDYPYCRIETDVPAECTIRSDRSILLLVLRNLVENAVEHGSTSPDSQARQDAVEHGSTSPPSSSTQEDTTGASSSEPSVADAPEDTEEHSSSSPPSAMPQEDAVEHGSTSPRSSSTHEDAEEHSSSNPDSQTSDSPETEQRSAVRITAERRDEHVVLEIADDGPGLPPNELEAIERGSETKLEHTSGLGLWLVQWGTARLGADLSFDTSDGTTVRLALPLESEGGNNGDPDTA